MCILYTCSCLYIYIYSSAIYRLNKISHDNFYSHRRLSYIPYCYTLCYKSFFSCSHTKGKLHLSVRFLFKFIFVRSYFFYYLHTLCWHIYSKQIERYTLHFQWINTTTKQIWYFQKDKSKKSLQKNSKTKIFKF